MKDYLQLLAVFALMLALIPCVGYAGKRYGAENAQSAETSAEVKILNETTGEIAEYSMKDYIIGAVFAQMPADFEEEALKAQAVLASTYARRRISSESESPDATLKGAHMSDDGDRFQAFFTEEQARELYGGDYDEAYEKISAAADFAENAALTYNDEPIMVAFHGISYGSTESALAMWGEDIPYLVSADSEWDSKLAQCETEQVFTESEMKDALTGEFPDCALGEDPADWISVAERSEGGTAVKVKVGDTVCEGSRFCELLGLPSRHFELSFSDGKFTFKVRGCGHLVGMSQYGANEMAKLGKSCEEILLHYFSGTTLVRKE